METLKDYLPLYLGQKIEYFDMFENKYSIGVLNGIHTNTGHFSVFVEGTSSGHDIDKCKLILRPLSSMTEEEAKEIGWGSAEAFKAWIKAINQSNNQAVFSVSQFKKLLERGFDIFNLKDKGLAIYE